MHKPARHKALQMAYTDSLLASIMVGSAETFAIIFAVKKGLSPHSLALLSTLPIFLGAVAQWIVPQFVTEKKLRAAILVCHGIQIVGLMLLLASIFVHNSLLCIFWALSFYWLGGMVSGPLWFDWICLWFQKEGHFSKFLSQRNALVALGTLFAYIGVSACIRSLSHVPLFALPFGVAVLVRLVSWFIVLKQPSPPPLLSELSPETAQKPGHQSPLTFSTSESTLFFMMAFTTLFKLMANISSPFFTPYMLQDLKLSLMPYVALTAVPFVGRFLFLSRWSGVQKSIHPYVWLSVCMFGICISPYLWTLTRNPYYIFYFELLSGLMWGCFELCTALIVQAFRPGKARGLVGMHLALMSLASLVGASLGAWGLEKGWSYKLLFLRSAELRLVVAFSFAIFLAKMQGPKASLQVYGDFLSNVLSLRPSLANIGRLIPARIRVRK